MIPRNFFDKYWYKPCTDRSVKKRIKRHENRVEQGRYVDSGQLVSANNSLYKLLLKKKATPEEIIVGDWLWNNKIYFQFQKGFFAPFHRICDFYLPAYGLIIEVDGGYHNETVDKDNYKDFAWNKERGKLTLRIPNEKVHSGEFVFMIEKMLSKIPPHKEHLPTTEMLSTG